MLREESRFFIDIDLLFKHYQDWIKIGKDSRLNFFSEKNLIINESNADYIKTVDGKLAYIQYKIDVEKLKTIHPYKLTDNKRFALNIKHKPDTPQLVISELETVNSDFCVKNIYDRNNTKRDFDLNWFRRYMADISIRLDYHGNQNISQKDLVYENSTIKVNDYIFPFLGPVIIDNEKFKATTQSAETVMTEKLKSLGRPYEIKK